MSIKIDCCADLHGHYPKLEGGDLLIVAGDLTARDTVNEYQAFCYWLFQQNYRKKIVIAGNHDNELKKLPLKFDPEITDFAYLCDSGTEFEGLKIWGSPWTKTFPGMNPKCKAFTVDAEEELAEKFTKIPEDTDILITHSPSYGILDWNTKGNLCGSTSLRDNVFERLNLKLHVFGHLHEAACMIDRLPCIFVNASHVNERYEPVNKPIRIEL